MGVSASASSWWLAGWLAGLSAVTYRRAGYIDTGDLYCVDSDSNFTY